MNNQYWQSKGLWGIFMVFLISSTGLKGQGVTGPTGGTAWMMGGASAAAEDVWSANNNPGAAGFAKYSQLGLYSEQRFMESNLKLANVSGIWKTKWLSIGSSVNYYGYNVFNQQKLGLSVGRQLSSQISLGIQLNYLATNIQDYGNAGSFVLGASLLFKPVDKLKAGLVLFNLTQSKYAGTLNERIPTIARMGLWYDVSKKVVVQMEADQTLNQKLVLRGGMSYQFHEVISLAIGAANNPVYYTIGTSLKLKKIKVDLASSFHEVLGYTPHLSLVLPVK